MPRIAFVVFFLISVPAAAAPPDFDRDVAPLLAEHCLSCHAGPKPRGDLDLTRKAAAMAEGRITPGDPAKSALWLQVQTGEMPPKKPLPAAAKATLKAWIESGAKWGTDPIDAFRFSTSTRAGQDWWSLQPVKTVGLPPTQPTDPELWTKNPIDAFLLAKLRDNGLSPSPPADRRTLIRRLSFDLVGLPPTPEEVDAFVNDPAVNALEKVVDRLLSSPHYGERWARHWLDVVRYGESQGFERNDPRPTAWPYRDWVIRSLNADMPYDEFTRFQIAGDMLHPKNPDAIPATGYLVAGVHNTVLPIQEAARQSARQDELEDIVGNLSQTFLGLTAQCARCHDHKFDPIPQKDYFRLASSVSGVTYGERSMESVAAKARTERAHAEVKRLESELAALERPAREAVLKARKNGELPKVLPPTPVLVWNFQQATAGPKLTTAGKAAFGDNGLALDGKTGYALSEPLAFDLREKTLEVRVRAENLTQRGGGVMSIQTPDGAVFDAIVFGEQEPMRWIAGSNNFIRTKSFQADDEKGAEPVHVAITYAADGTIAAYRNGKLYGTPYKSVGLQPFTAGKAVVAFGLRHSPAGGNKHFAGTVLQARLYDRALTAEEVAAAAASDEIVTEAELVGRLTDEFRQKRETLKASLRTALAERTAVLAVQAPKVFTAVPVQPPVTRLLIRGQASEPADVVPPGGVGAVGSSDFKLTENAPEAERRVHLAKWITDPKNPLFARVMVNRLWHYHFGIGLVETPSDFGFNGGRPSHPELLDWLAAEFAERKYSLKTMHKLIVMSAAYRQSSSPRKDALAIDADTRLLWRKRPQRLEAEAVRDTILQTAGLLDLTLGGKGFSDYKVTPNNGTTYYDPIDSADRESQRRSIYRFVPRGSNPGLLDTFDCPDPAAAAPRRATTTTPLQALTLWNGPFALRTSGAFAERLKKEVGNDPAAQVKLAYRLAFQRLPNDAESAAAVKLVSTHGLAPLTRALLNSNEFLTVE